MKYLNITFTFKYYVKDPENSSKHQLCRSAFCMVHGITSICLRVFRGNSSEESSSNNGFNCPSTDKHDLYKNRSHSVSEESRTLKKAIDDCPKYTSHYSRRSNPHNSYVTSVHSVSEKYKCTIRGARTIIKMCLTKYYRGLLRRDEVSSKSTATETLVITIDLQQAISTPYL